MSRTASEGRARFTALSMMKDEGPGLLEWVAHHRLAGFDRIVVFTNDCTDGTDAMLDRLEAMGELRHLRNPVPPGKKPQPHALRLARAHPAVIGSDWILPLDADEFLNVKVGAGRVCDLVAAVPDGTDAIAITWRVHGSAGLTHWCPGLATERYDRAAPDDFPKGWG